MANSLQTGSAGLHGTGAPSASRSGRRLSGIRIIPPPLQLHRNMAQSYPPSFSRHVESPAVHRDMLPGGTRSPLRRTAEGVASRTSYITEADAREKLSGWTVYRFEKVQHSNLDQHGYPAKPSWDHVTRAQIAGYSRCEVARRVRDLDRKAVSVQEKKAGLSGPILRQLDMALEELLCNEPDSRYRHVLAQIDCEFRESDSSDESDSHHKDGNRRSHTRRKSSSSQKSKTKTRRTLERVSVTAYFKRAPGSGEDVLGMYQSREGAARQSPTSQRHRHGRHHSYPHVDTGAKSLSPRATPPPRSPFEPTSQLKAEYRRHRYSESAPITGSFLTQRDLGSTAVRAGSSSGVRTPSTRESPRTSRSSLCSDDTFSAVLTPMSSVDGTSLLRHQMQFLNRSPSRERPRPPPRTRSPSPDRDADLAGGNYVWVGSKPKSSQTPVPHSRPLPIDGKRLKPGRFETRRGTEPREGGEKGSGRTGGRSSPLSPHSPHSPFSTHSPHSPHSHRRRTRVRFADSDELDSGSSGSERDTERQRERLSLGAGEHRVRFSEQASKGSSRRDQTRQSRRSADSSSYPDPIFHMEDFA